MLREISVRVVFVTAALGSLAMAEDRDVIDLQSGVLPANMAQNHVRAAAVEHGGQPAIRVDFTVADWPNVFFTPPNGASMAS